MRKKVSCASRAGCCWGWKRASKFQNELSMKLLVGISVKLWRKGGTKGRRGEGGRGERVRGDKGKER